VVCCCGFSRVRPALDKPAAESREKRPERRRAPRQTVLTWFGKTLMMQAWPGHPKKIPAGTSNRAQPQGCRRMGVSSSSSRLDVRMGDGGRGTAPVQFDVDHSNGTGIFAKIAQQPPKSGPRTEVPEMKNKPISVSTSLCPRTAKTRRCQPFQDASGRAVRNRGSKPAETPSAAKVEKPRRSLRHQSRRHLLRPPHRRPRQALHRPKLQQ